MGIYLLLCPIWCVWWAGLQYTLVSCLQSSSTGILPWIPHHLNGGPVAHKIQIPQFLSSAVTVLLLWASSRNVFCFKFIRFLWNHDSTLTAQQCLLSPPPHSSHWIAWIKSIFFLLGQLSLDLFKWMNHTEKLNLWPWFLVSSMSRFITLFWSLGCDAYLKT